MTRSLFGHSSTCTAPCPACGRSSLRITATATRRKLCTRNWWLSTSSIHPTEAVDENIVRKKIQAFCTVYKKEVNKVEKSVKSGAGTDDVYVPKLWYYDLLVFTRDQEIPRPSQTVTSLCAPSAEEILPESPDEHVPPEQLQTPEDNDDETPQSSVLRKPVCRGADTSTAPISQKKGDCGHTCGSPGTGQQHNDPACHNPAHRIPILRCRTLK
ncbi:unnamed protein product [Ranitomeya imitator]|uniref:MADF domain-containing protein n=1 Tax=Ranitomeya imitator TaxID=111125 RepID=A0ABN9M9K9_9NEOB|nr:unnamed protein product [Ranitomeya imitator]